MPETGFVNNTNKPLIKGAFFVLKKINVQFLYGLIQNVYLLCRRMARIFKDIPAFIGINSTAIY